MDLVEEYLRAVAILLPRTQADDIIAELRDTILSRIEAREAELGRPLTDDEVEAVLREVGHPLVVAARYREGPQHVVGPTLYPYWTFAVKLGLAIQVVAALLVLIGRTIAGGDFGLAIGQAISSVINGGLVIVGLATVAAWLIERRGYRIGYLDTWHVRDLWFLEYIAWDWDTVRDGLSGRGWGNRRWGGPPPSGGSAAGPKASRPDSRPQARRQAERGSQPPRAEREAASPTPPPNVWSPIGHGMGMIVGGAILLLWWLGPARFDIDLGVWAPGIDPGGLDKVDWQGLRAVLFWPVLVYGLGVILRGVVFLASPWAVRLQGLLDAISGAAVVGFGAWLWTASPISDAVRVDGLAEFMGRLAPLNGHAVPLAPVATAVVAIIVVNGLFGLMRGLWDLIAGPPPDGPWAYGV